MLRSGEFAERVAAKLEADHHKAMEEIIRLQRELATVTAQQPTDQLQQTVRTVLSRALAGDVAARGMIADALPGLVGSIRCLKDGRVRVQSRHAPLAWTVKLH
jgi:hypothetical protein